MGIPREKIVIWKAADGWRYKAKAGNNRTIGASEQGHESKKYQAQKAMKAHPGMPIFIILPGDNILSPIDVGVRGLTND